MTKIAWATTLTVGAVLSVLGASAATAPENRAALLRDIGDQRDSAEASQVLDRAQSWIGGSAKVAAVTGLQLVRVEDTYKILFPDMYRRDVDGKPVLAFDGGVLRRQGVNGRPDSRTVSDPRLRGLLAAVDSMNTPENIRRSGRREVAMYALRYLVRRLPTYPMTARLVDRGLCANEPGACIEFLPDDDSAVHMAVDGASGRPLALVTRMAGAAGGLLTVEKLDDYRVIDGLRLPLSIVTQRVSPDGTRDQPRSEAYQSIRVSPPLRASDFALPAAK